MEVIPAINCGDEGCVKKHLEMLQDIPAEWVHFDVSDGKFTPTLTWNNPKFLETESLKIEVHLMVEKPEEYVERWVGLPTGGGAKRIIFHIETMLGKFDPA